MIIGITGLTGGGKSLMSRVFAEKGAYVIDADDIAHKALYRTGSAYSDVVNAFGREILDEQGEIDRKKLGNIVFGSPEKLQMLNNISHGHICKDIWDIITQIQCAPRRYAAIVIDVLYLFESQVFSMCDVTISVAADADVRLQRIIRRDGLTEEAALSRIRGQKGLDTPERLALADFVVYNNDDMESFIKKAEELAQNVFNTD